MRLDKYLANSGIGSRSEVKKFIISKNVTVNGSIVINPEYKVSENDEIKFKDNIITYKKYVYLMLNKPQGFVSAVFDNYHKTVLDLIKEYKTYNLFPVGRLDIDTEGLLILTNDGKFSHNVISPKKDIFKTYYVILKNNINIEEKKLIENGITLDDGYITKKSKIKLIRDNEVEISICEGKFHQVKRMFKAVNNEVKFLKRIKIGKLILDENLKLGSYKELTEIEMKGIFE